MMASTATAAAASNNSPPPTTTTTTRRPSSSSTSEKARARWKLLREAVVTSSRRGDPHETGNTSSSSSADDVILHSLVHRNNRPTFSETYLNKLRTVRVSKPRSDSSTKNNEGDESYQEELLYSRLVRRVEVVSLALHCCHSTTSSSSNCSNHHTHSSSPSSSSSSSSSSIVINLIAAGNAISTAVDMASYLLRVRLAQSIKHIETSLVSHHQQQQQQHVSNDNCNNNNNSFNNFMMKSQQQQQQPSTTTSIIMVQVEVPESKIYQLLVMDSSSSSTAVVADTVVKDEDKSQQQQGKSTTHHHNHHEEYECVEYTIDVASSEASVVANNKTCCIKIRARERRRRKNNKNKKMDLKALMSEQHYGVDNTGNIHVWDCEYILTHCLMNGSISKLLKIPHLGALVDFNRDNKIANNDPLSSSSSSTFRVIELGCGMVGVAGLALAAKFMAGISASTAAGKSDVEVYLTDGHPKAVENNLISNALTSAYYDDIESSSSSSVNVQARRLLWKADKEGARDCRSLTRGGRCHFHLCLVSDCLHFKEFHAALLVTIGRLIAVNGFCVLCQPERGDSLKLFLSLVHDINMYYHDNDGDNNNNVSMQPLFEVQCIDDFDEEVSRQHQLRMESLNAGDDDESNSSYDPLKQNPKLIILRKIREFNETLDTKRANDSLEARKQST